MFCAKRFRAVYASSTHKNPWSRDFRLLPVDTLAASRDTFESPLVLFSLFVFDCFQGIKAADLVKGTAYYIVYSAVRPLWTCKLVFLLYTFTIIEEVWCCTQQVLLFIEVTC